MPLNFLKKAAEAIGEGLKKALEAFGTLALYALAIVIAYVGIDVAVYAIREGLGVLEAILALIP